MPPADVDAGVGAVRPGCGCRLVPLDARRSAFSSLAIAGAALGFARRRRGRALLGSDDETSRSPILQRAGAS